MQSPWSPQRVVSLRKWWREGLSGGVIAAHFCAEGFPATRNSVIGKVHRLGLEARAPRKTQWLGRPGARERKPKVPAAVKFSWSDFLPPALSPLWFWEPRLYGFDATPCGCSYIEGHVGGSWFYCNAAKAGTQYCVEHAAICRRSVAPTPKVAGRRSSFGNYWLSAPAGEAALAETLVEA